MRPSPNRGVLIQKWAQRLIRSSVTLVNWVWPSPRTVEYQIAISYAGAVGEMKTQPDEDKFKNLTLKCPSYPTGSSKAVFAKKQKAQREFTLLDALTDRPLEGGEDLPRSNDIVYRFVGGCVKGGCFHWTGESCRLGEAVASVKIRKKHEAKCAIRSSCRWYAENSFDACGACPYILYSTLLTFNNVESGN